MIEADADAGVGPQCIVVTPTRFFMSSMILILMMENLFVFIDPNSETVY